MEQEDSRAKCRRRQANNQIIEGNALATSGKPWENHGCCWRSAALRTGDGTLGVEAQLGRTKRTRKGRHPIVWQAEEGLGGGRTMCGKQTVKLK